MALTFTGPVPLHRGAAHPLGWCVLCAADAKSRAIDELDGREDGEVFVDLARDSLAVAYGLVMLPTPPEAGLGGQPVVLPMPLCWGHLRAVRVMETSLVPGSSLPGGAVDLSQRRRG